MGPQRDFGNVFCRREAMRKRDSMKKDTATTCRAKAEGDTTRIVLKTALIAAIIGGTCLHFFDCQFNNPLQHLFSDPQRHWDNGLVFLKPELMSGCDPILYQVYLYLVQQLTRGNAIAVGLITAALSASMPWVYYRAARELGISRNPSLIYWAIMAWVPSFLIIYRYFMIETLLLPLIGLGLWMTGRAMRKKNASSFFVMTTCWMFACLTKPQAIPMALVCGLFVLWRMTSRLKLAAAGAAIIAIMLLPNALRTYEILGYAAPFGSGYIAQIMHKGGTKHTRFYWNGGIWIYSSPSCYIMPLEPLNFWRIERADNDDVREVVVRKEKGREDWDEALSSISLPAGKWWQHLKENIILFLFAPSWPDSGDSTPALRLSYLIRWIWSPIICQVIVGNALWFVALRRLPLVATLATVMLLVLMLQNSVTIEGRYRKPLEPLLILNVIWLFSLSGEQEDNRGKLMSQKEGTDMNPATAGSLLPAGRSEAARGSVPAFLRAAAKHAAQAKIFQECFENHERLGAGWRTVLSWIMGDGKLLALPAVEGGISQEFRVDKCPV
jgi:Dolichyl-phosphate-mannose-protein mannosyltransferase